MSEYNRFVVKGPVNLNIERGVAQAHSYVWRAALDAESLRDQGLADDLHQVAHELRRINESLVRSHKYRRPSAR